MLDELGVGTARGPSKMTNQLFTMMANLSIRNFKLNISIWPNSVCCNGRWDSVIWTANPNSIATNNPTILGSNRHIDTGSGSP